MLTLLASMAALAPARVALAQAQSAPPQVVQSWSLSPAGNNGGIGDRANLSYQLAPGTEAKDAITLFNYGTVQMNFDVYATDAENNSAGAFDPLPGDRSPKDVGSWITLPQRAVTVAPGQAITFPITISVPVTARPGDHAGAVLAASVAQGTGPDGKVVNLDRRTGSRVYVRVAGPLQPKLTVDRLSSSYRPSLNPFSGAATVKYRIANRGNVRLAGSRRVSVGGPLGLLRHRAAATDVAELLPGQTVTATQTFHGVAATFVAIARVDLRPKTMAGDSAAGAAVRRTGFVFAVPLTIVALALAGLLLLRARRSYLAHRAQLQPA